MKILNDEPNIKINVQEPVFMRIMNKNINKLQAMLEKEIIIEDETNNILFFKTENQELIEYISTWAKYVHDAYAKVKSYPEILNMEANICYERMILELYHYDETGEINGDIKRYKCISFTVPTENKILISYL